jgi:cytochrome P450
VLIPYWFIMLDGCNFPCALELLPERWVECDDNGAWVEHSTVDTSKVNLKDEDASQISASSDETTVPESNPCQKKNTAESESSLVNDVVPAANKLAFLPFSIGARNCVGLKLASKTMCIIFVELLRHLKFELVPGFKIDPTTSGVGLKHNGEIPMIISKR